LSDGLSERSYPEFGRQPITPAGVIAYSGRQVIDNLHQPHTLHPEHYQSPWRTKKMRKFIALLFATALVGSNAYAVESQPLDESTNPNANTDIKTQKMQQKPNKDQTDRHDDEDRGYYEPSKSRSDSNRNYTDDEMDTRTTR
jgi:hypothetical protein